MTIKPSKIMQASLEEIDLKDAQRFNRRINPNRVEQIARYFDPNLMHPGIGYKLPNGKWGLIDSQHTIAAAFLVGMPVVNIQDSKIQHNQHKALSHAFKLFNSLSQPVRGNDIYWADIFAREPNSVRMRSVFKNIGVELNRRTNKSKNGVLGAVEQVRRLSEKHGMEVIEKASNVLHNCFLNDENVVKEGALRGEFIQALIDACSKKDLCVKKIGKNRSPIEIALKGKLKAKTSGTAIPNISKVIQRMG